MKRKCKHRHKLVLCKLLLNDVMCFFRCASKSGKKRIPAEIYNGEC